MTRTKEERNQGLRPDLVNCYDGFDAHPRNRQNKQNSDFRHDGIHIFWDKYLSLYDQEITLRLINEKVAT